MKLEVPVIPQNVVQVSDFCYSECSIGECIYITDIDGVSKLYIRDFSTLNDFVNVLICYPSGFGKIITGYYDLKNPNIYLNQSNKTAFLACGFNDIREIKRAKGSANEGKELADRIQYFGHLVAHYRSIPDYLNLSEVEYDMMVMINRESQELGGLRLLKKEKDVCLEWYWKSFFTKKIVCHEFANFDETIIVGNQFHFSDGIINKKITIHSISLEPV